MSFRFGRASIGSSSSPLGSTPRGWGDRKDWAWLDDGGALVEEDDIIIIIIVVVVW
jgi:hypothetical protein